MIKEDETLVGKKFNKLTATEKIKNNGKTSYKCTCNCGKSTIVTHWKLYSGRTKSCGCSRKDADKTRNIDKRLEEGVSCSRRVIYYYQRNATNRGIEFHLTDEECLKLFKRNCKYCNREPFTTISYKGYNGSFTYTGIDRIDSLKGYTTDNVVPCCKDCNYMKRDLSGL